MRPQPADATEDAERFALFGEIVMSYFVPPIVIPATLILALVVWVVIRPAIVDTLPTDPIVAVPPSSD